MRAKARSETAPERLAAETHRTGAGGLLARQHLHQRTLAGAIGPDQPVDTAGLQRQVQWPDDGRPPTAKLAPSSENSGTSDEAAVDNYLIPETGSGTAMPFPKT